MQRSAQELTVEKEAWKPSGDTQIICKHPALLNPQPGCSLCSSMNPVSSDLSHSVQTYLKVPAITREHLSLAVQQSEPEILDPQVT